jgi:hypothetical protein
MGETLVTSLVALSTAVVVALWQVGGRAALARRTIKQELDIATALPACPERQHLIQLARDRATLYVYRRRSPDPSGTARRRLIAATVAAPVIFSFLFIAGEFTVEVGGFPHALVSVSSAALQVLIGGLVGYWVSYSIRLHRARRREQDLGEARAALGP